jgi:hypothetical protein
MFVLFFARGIPLRITKWYLVKQERWKGQSICLYFSCYYFNAVYFLEILILMSYQFTYVEGIHIESQGLKFSFTPN